MVSSVGDTVFGCNRENRTTQTMQVVYDEVCEPDDGKCNGIGIDCIGPSV